MDNMANGNAMKLGVRGLPEKSVHAACELASHAGDAL
jgi:hypothetical protein